MCIRDSFINDDFSRDGGSLQPHRDPATKKTYLCLVEDIPYGEEPSFAYGADFWSDKLLTLLPQSRLACIRKYKFAPTIFSFWDLDQTAIH